MLWIWWTKNKCARVVIKKSSKNYYYYFVNLSCEAPFHVFVANLENKTTKWKSKSFIALFPIQLITHKNCLWNVVSCFYKKDAYNLCEKEHVMQCNGLRKFQNIKNISSFNPPPHTLYQKICRKKMYKIISQGRNNFCWQLQSPMKHGKSV